MISLTSAKLGLSLLIGSRAMRTYVFSLHQSLFATMMHNGVYTPSDCIDNMPNGIDSPRSDKSVSDHTIDLSAF